MGGGPQVRRGGFSGLARDVKFNKMCVLVEKSTNSQRRRIQTQSPTSPVGCARPTRPLPCSSWISSAAPR